MVHFYSNNQEKKIELLHIRSRNNGEYYSQCTCMSYSACLMPPPPKKKKKKRSNNYSPQTSYTKRMQSIVGPSPANRKARHDTYKQRNFARRLPKEGLHCLLRVWSLFSIQVNVAKKVQLGLQELLVHKGLKEKGVQQDLLEHQLQ